MSVSSLALLYGNQLSLVFLDIAEVNILDVFSVLYLFLHRLDGVFGL